MREDWVWGDCNDELTRLWWGRVEVGVYAPWVGKVREINGLGADFGSGWRPLVAPMASFCPLSRPLVFSLKGLGVMVRSASPVVVGCGVDPRER